MKPRRPQSRTSKGALAIRCFGDVQSCKGRKGGSKGRIPGTSRWHGKTYGLEVDPWAAVDPVPYPCAVSLKWSFEEFAAPKHVRKGHCTNTLQMKSSGAFALANKFSILASDDEESPGESDAAKHVTRIQCQPWKGGEFSCCVEQADESITLRPKCPVSKDLMHRR